MLYKAFVTFLKTEEGRPSELTFDIIYEAVHKQHAVISAWRWSRNRQRAVPEHFGKVGCIKIVIFVPQTVDEEGYLGANTGFDFYEWKIDEGVKSWGAQYHPKEDPTIV